MTIKLLDVYAINQYNIDKGDKQMRELRKSVQKMNTSGQPSGVTPNQQSPPCDSMDTSNCNSSVDITPENFKLLEEEWEKYTRPLRPLYTDVRRTVRILRSGLEPSFITNSQEDVQYPTVPSLDKLVSIKTPTDIGDSPESQESRPFSAISGLESKSPNSPGYQFGMSTAIPLTAARKAELLSLLCDIAERFSSKNVGYPGRLVTCIVTVIIDALESPSLVLRLLGLHCTKFLCCDCTFFNTFLSYDGFMLVTAGMDSEQPKEIDYSLALIQYITKLKNKKKLDANLPYFVVARIVSFVDPIDQRTVTLTLKEQAIGILHSMLEAFPAQVAAADGIRHLMLACLDPEIQQEYRDRIVKTIISMFDDPLLRQFIRDGDIVVIFAPFTEGSYSGSSGPEVIALAREVITKILCTWPGLLWLSTETAGLRSLIDVLHLPGHLNRKFSLICLFNQCIRSLAPHRGIPAQGPWEITKEKNTYQQGICVRHSHDSICEEYKDVSFEDNWNQYLEYMDGGVEEEDLAPITTSVGYHSRDIFLGALLLVFNHQGLPHALISLMKQSALEDSVVEDYTQLNKFDTDGPPGTTLMKEAAILIQHIIVLLDTLLPRATASKLIRAINETIASLALDGHTFAGGLTTTLFHSLAYTSGHQSIFCTPSTNMGGGGSSIVTHGGVFPGSLEVGIELDDNEFTAMLRESHVEQSNDPTKWNLDVLFSLCQGPLKSLTRLKHTRDKTHIIHRLVTFFHPYNKTAQLNHSVDFTTIIRKYDSRKWTAFGIVLLDLLLLTREGVDFLERMELCKAFKLAFNDLIVQYKKCQSNQTAHPKRNAGNTIYQLHHTLTTEYLRLLGRFTLSANGLILLKKHDIFHVITELLNLVSDKQRSSSEPLPKTDTRNLKGGVSPLSGIKTSDQTTSVIKLETSHEYVNNMTYIRADIVGVLSKTLSFFYIGSVPNYGVCDELRLILKKTFDTSQGVLKKVCVFQIGRVVFRDLSSSLVWGVDRLLECLSDSNSVDVVDRSYKLIASVCFSSKQALDYLISKNPVKCLLKGELVWERRKELNLTSLLYRMVGRKKGFKILEDAKWVDRELGAWKLKRALLFVKDFNSIFEGKWQIKSGTVPDGSPCGQKNTFHGGSVCHKYTFSDPFSYPCGHQGGKALTAVALSMQVAHSVFPDHFVAELCQHEIGCDKLHKSALWEVSLATLFSSTTLRAVDGNTSSATVETFTSQKEAGHKTYGDLCQEVVGGFNQDISVRDHNNYGFESDFEQTSLLEHPGSQISAARGYASSYSTTVVDCDPNNLESLKAAIYVVSFAASSDVGFERIRKSSSHSRDIVNKIVQLSQYASHPSVRGCAIVGLSIISRSSKGAEFLGTKYRYAVVHETTAYTDNNGIPFSVSYARSPTTSWMNLCHSQYKGNAPEHAYDAKTISALKTPKAIVEMVTSLLNPVQREEAKKKIYTALEEQPSLFLSSATVRFMRETSNIYRMRHAERKFLADCYVRIRALRYTGDNPRGKLPVKQG